MKQRIALCLICLLILCSSLCACSSLNRDPIYADFDEKQATLSVNGTTLDVDGVYVCDGFEYRYPDAPSLLPIMQPAAYAKIPLVEVLTQLGVEVAWQDEQRATLTYGDQSLLLNISEQTVTEPGKNDTWIHIVEGHVVCVRETVEKDLIVDNNSLDEVLWYFFGNQTPTFTMFDWENGTVTVTVQKLAE